MNGKGRVVLGSVIALTSTTSFGTMILSMTPRAQVGLVAQCNIAVWDPETKMEHLIQSSAFMSQAKRFEFLVPTPTLPRVREVGDVPINLVTGLITPPRPVPIAKPDPEDELDPNFGVLIRPKVEVKQVTFVGNLKATTIRASDILALTDWMSKNGYKASQSQNEWLERYVQKRWFITAFQVNSDSEAIKTSSVRLSFKTEAPYVPYTSPRNNWGQGIKQEVFLVTPKAMQGTTTGKGLWSGKLTGHKFLTRDATANFAKSLGLTNKDIPSQSWVNRYIDESPADSPTDDLYFFPIPKGTKLSAKLK